MFDNVESKNLIIISVMIIILIILIRFIFRYIKNCTKQHILNQPDGQEKLNTLNNTFLKVSNSLNLFYAFTIGFIVEIFRSFSKSNKK